ncbi:unnamed protein product [Callosobruchus maculatus]|uniref:Uncharacterized protein n=1 Tax=Callosobruchus maculatus TaxID=64391 RepID=A0A653D399_CALMS|nr:unnamed protein product [Callosobruchus maculatus]
MFLKFWPILYDTDAKLLVINLVSYIVKSHIASYLILVIPVNNVRLVILESYATQDVQNPFKSSVKYCISLESPVFY